MRKWLLFCVGGMVMWCATPLTKKYFPRQRIADIVVGQTTQKDIHKIFGDPLYHGMSPGDEEWWMYIHTQEDNSESLSIYFTEKGTVKEFNYTPYHKSLSEKQEQ